MITTILMAAGLAGLPTIAAIAGICIAVGKFRKNLGELKAEVVKTKQYDDLKEQLLISHKEHIETQKRLNDLLTEITKIRQNNKEK